MDGVFNVVVFVVRVDIMFEVGVVVKIGMVSVVGVDDVLKFFFVLVGDEIIVS